MQNKQGDYQVDFLVKQQKQTQQECVSKVTCILGRKKTTF